MDGGQRIGLAATQAMMPVLSLGGFTLAVGPLAFLMAIWVGSEVGERTMRRLAVPGKADDRQRAFSLCCSTAVWPRS